MIRLMRNLLTLRHDYKSPIDRQLAFGVMVISVAIISLGSIAITGALVVALAGGQLFEDPTIVVRPFGAVLIYVLVQSGRLRLASWLLFFVFIIAATSSMGDVLNVSAVIVLALPISVVGSMLPWREALLAYIVLVGLVLSVGFSQLQITSPTTLTYADTALSDIALVVPTITVALALLLLLKEYSRNLVTRLLRDNELMRATNRMAAGLIGKDEYPAALTVLTFLRDEMRYSYVALYLSDESGKLNRRLWFGMGIRPSLNEQRDVALSDSNALNDALDGTDIVRVQATDNQMRIEHLREASIGGLAVPVFIGDRTIGVLDVQYDWQRPDDENARAVLFASAAALAASIVHSRRLQSLREEVNVQQQVEENLRERLRRYGEGLPTDSPRGNRDEDMRYFGYDANLEETGNFVPVTDLPDELREGFARNVPQITEDNDRQVLHIPIILRGEPLGAMAFTLPRGQIVTQRQLEMAQIVSNRLALALENKRLYEQAQSLARREQQANEAARLLASATDVDTVLKVAVENFNRALGAVGTRITLNNALMLEADSNQRSEQPL